MKVPEHLLARLAIVVLGTAATACFFFPLFTLHVPVKRDREFRGVDLLTEVTGVVREIRSDAEDAREHPKGDKQPLSVRLSGLIGLELILAAACAALGAVLSLRGLKPARAIVAAGAVLALAALAHVAWVNWEVRGMFAGQAQDGAGLFARFGRRIGNRLAQRFSMVPGWGLLGMTGCLLLATLAGRSGRKGQTTDSAGAPPRNP